jgi:hypothetical protein
MVVELWSQDQGCLAVFFYLTAVGPGWTVSALQIEVDLVFMMGASDVP